MKERLQGAVGKGGVWCWILKHGENRAWILFMRKITPGWPGREGSGRWGLPTFVSTLGPHYLADEQPPSSILAVLMGQITPGLL